MKKIKAFFIVLIGSTLSIAGLSTFFISEQSYVAEASQDKSVRAEVHPPFIDPFKDIAIEAYSAFIFDVTENKVIFSRNENMKLPLASLTKLMTAFVAKDQIGDNVVVTLTQDDIEEEGDSGLRAGERFRITDLLDTMLLVS